MNKLLTKIVGLSLGLSMAIGVGVAVAATKSNPAEPVEASETSDGEGGYYDTFGTGTFDTDHITWSVCSGNITMVQTKGSSSTAVNASYVADARVYKGHILHFGAASGYAIKKIEITYSTTNRGNSMTAGISASSTTVTDDTTNVTRTWDSASGGTHVVSSASSSGLSDIYIQNVASGSNVQLRWASGGVKIYYTKPSGGDSVTLISSITGTPTAYASGSWDLTSLVVKGTKNGASDSTITDLVDLSTNTPVPSTSGSVSVSVTASLKDGVSGGASDYTTSLTGTVSESALIDTNLSALSWDGSSYAASPHVLTMNSTYTWGVSAGQYNSSIGYLGANSNNSKYITVNGSDWTMTGSDYSSIQSVMATGDGSSSYWSTYGSAFRMLNFGVVHPRSFVVNAGTVGSSTVKKYFILASADSGETWELLANGDIDASTDMGWNNASKYASESKPIQFAFVYTTDSVKTISNVSVKVYADSSATTKVLDSIFISGTPVKDYTVGESFDLGSAKVYAHYTDSTTYPDVDISSDPGLSWTSIEHGTTSVTGTFSGKSIEVTGLNVTDEGSVYKKIVSTDELIEGAKVVFATSDGTYSMGKQTANNRKGEAAGGEFGFYDDGDFENWSVNTTVFTVGITDNGYTFFDAKENGYLYASSSSNNYLRTRAEVGTDLCAEWSISIADGVATIVDAGENTNNTINYTTSAGVHTFGAYANTTVVVISLYADVAGTVQAFIDANMHTDIPYDPDPDLPINNTKDCLNSDWYVDAKKVLVALGDAYIEEFQTNDSFANALARYNAWALACGDTTPFEGAGIVSSGSSIFGMSDSQINQTTAIIVVISVLSVSAIGGFFFLRKRKEQ